MTHPAELLGRQEELGVIQRLLDGVPAGGATLVLRGEAGIGKSRLLQQARTGAMTRGFRVLATAGTQAETHLPFAGLHRLLRPILSSANELPEPQRGALDAALGLSDQAAPSPFLIALAVLNLVSDAAAEAPLLLLAEDAHWLDRPTCDVLAFVGRRLEAEPVLLLAALRYFPDGNPLTDPSLPSHDLIGLGQADAGALLDAASPGLEQRVRDKVLALAQGNPLALVELPRTLPSGQPTALPDLPATLPLSERLERAFATQAADLPEETQELLLVAALDDGGVLEEILAAGRICYGRERGPEALTPALNAKLVEISGLELSFRHPLVRSALSQRADVLRRRAVHAALAQALNGQPDRAAWHRAAAQSKPNEEVAAELDAVAGRALRRGAVGVAVTALERAAALGTSGEENSRRLLRAGLLAYELAGPDRAREILVRVDAASLGSVDLANLRLAREVSLGAVGDPAVILELVDLARGVSAVGEVRVAISLLRVSALQCWWFRHERAVLEAVAQALGELTAGAGDPEALATLAMVRPLDGAAQVLGALSGDSAAGGGEADSARFLGHAAYVIGDLERAATLLDQTANWFRSQGRLGLLVSILALRAWTAVHLGEWRTALSAAEEAQRLARESAQEAWVVSAALALAVLAGLRGDEAGAVARLREAEQILTASPRRAVAHILGLARGLASLTAGRLQEALEHLSRAFDDARGANHPLERCLVASHLVDVAMHSGQRELAATVTLELEELERRSASPGVKLLVSYLRAVSSQESGAGFQAALDHDLRRWPFLRARLQLAYGAWLRRQRRIVESRAPLQAALEVFDRLGAPSWSEQARRELRASGITSRPRVTGVSDQLSPQEQQIAQLASDGLSNREIGQHLFLSPRTVASHLYRIFPKLGITSRQQLANALPR